MMSRPLAPGLPAVVDPPIADLRDLIAARQVVIILGAGVSMAASGKAPTAGWKGLLHHGVERCRGFAGADARWCERQRGILDEGETDEWINVARLITQKLGGARGGEYRRWLREAVGELPLVDGALIDAIAALGCPVATTNYDDLFERGTGLKSVSWDEDHKVDRWLRGDERAVLHLHGHWERPESVVLGVESYLSVRDAPHAIAVRQALRMTKSLLFIGCGDTTADPNIGAWLRWSAEVFSGAEYRNYRLEPDGRVSEVQQQHPPTQRLFVLGYGASHGDLPSFVRGLGSTPAVSSGATGDSRQVVSADPESRLRALIADRIGELPAVFELDGKRHALSEVYVELALSPESLPHLKGDDCDLQRISRIDDVLTHPVRRWTLCGEAGCGKTTLLHHLADTLLNDRALNLLPVPLRVAELQRGDRLITAVTRAYDAESAALVAAACAAGRAVILLDGLDEAVSPDDARAAVLSLAADAGKSVLIVSSRDTAYTRPGAGFGELRVLPLTDDQQLDLLSRWVGATRARAELAPLARRPRLARMAKNPLLLTLMGLVLLREPGSTLPAKRAELYERAVGLLLRGAHRPDLKRRFDDPPLVREVLARLALTLHGQEQTTWPLTRLREVIEADARAWLRVKEIWKSADRFLEDVAQVSDLLMPEGPRGDPRGYRFPHRTFREFLASVALADDLSRNGLGEVSHEVLQRVARGEPAGKMKLPKGELHTVLSDGVKRPDIWAEVLALTAGQLGEGGPDRLVRRVAAVGDRRLLLRVVADADGLQTDTVDAALALERGWEQWESRRKILEDLPGLVGDPAAVVSLLRRFVTSTTDGNDLYWAREGLRAIAAGTFPGEPVEPSVREEAAAAAAGIFDHMQGNLAAVQALLEPCWRKIPKGSFKMGSDEFDDEKPIHDVQFTSDFSMLNVPVTWAMCRLFDPGHDAARDTFGGKLPPGAQAQVPVYRVTWYAATMFAAWVGARLPLEPEWEYACRAGTTTRYWSGDTEADLARVGWYNQNSGGHPHPVGQKPANPWGLHDVHGNVWEWCQDPWQDSYADAPGVVDPSAVPPAGAPSAWRVVRGGSWYSSAGSARAAYRSWDDPTWRGRDQGFRLVLPSPVPVPPAGS